MSRLTSALLFASGLTVEEVTLFKPSEFLEDARSKGVLVALKNAIVQYVLRTMWLLWKLFAPYVLVRQILAVIVLQVGHEAIWPFFRNIIAKIFLRERQTKETDELDKRIADLEKEMENAEYYDEWREAARLVEALRNQKYQVVDGVVNTRRVQRMKVKTNLYNRLVEVQDAEELQYRLRSELHRKHWGLGSTDDATTRAHPEYRAALHDYLDAVCSALALIARGGKKRNPEATLVKVDSDTLEDITPYVEDDEPLEKKVAALRERCDFFSETLHSFGRTALLLSGGARLGLLHLGVVRALLDQKLLPRVISGSSAGSIVAVMLGAWRDDELNDHLFNPANMNLHFFALMNEGKDDEATLSKNPLLSMLLLLPPPLPSLVHGVSQILPFWFSTGTLLDVEVLMNAIRDSTGDLTFKEAFERTGRIINITVSPSGDNDYPMLLNYLTAPRVLIWSASVASCAIPGVFAPVELMAKDMHGNIVPYYQEKLKWADGSVESDLPMQRLSELFNINHFVVSQVNPHARLLAPMSRRARGKIRETTTVGRFLKKLSSATDETTKVVVNFCRDQSRSSVKHLASAMLLLSPLFPLFSPLKLIGKSVVPILTQKYTGDITIMPPMTFKGMMTIMSNPSPEEFLDDLRQGERVTWPHISRMRLHVAIEFLLEDCRNSCRRQLTRLEQELFEASHASPRFARQSSGLDQNSLLGSPPIQGTFRTKASVDHTGIPTASVLNLHDLDISNAVFKTSQPPRNRRSSSVEGSSSNLMANNQHPQQVTTGPAKMPRNTSFLGLSDKLKSRVQSFAADLSVLGRNMPSDSIDNPTMETLIDADDDAESTGSGI